MRPTIVSLQNEITQLTNHLYDLRGEFNNSEALVKSLSAQLDAQVRRNEDQQKTMRVMEREMVLNAEILRLTRELLATKTGTAAAGVTLSPDPDILYMADGKKVSRKAAEEAAAHGRSNGLSSGGFIPAIKSVREQTGCSLKEAKEFCDYHFAHLKDPDRQPWRPT